MSRIKYSLVGFLLLAGCSDVNGGKERLPGERISAYSVTSPIIADLSISAKKYTAPEATSTTWSTSKYPLETLGKNLSLPKGDLRSVKKHGLTSSKYATITNPVISENAIFTLDNAGYIQAINTNTSKQIWQNNDLIKDKTIAKLRDKSKLLFGGILLHQNRLFVSAGFKGIVAIDAISGKTIWVKELSTMVRGVPMHLGNKIIVQAANNNIFALDAANGEVIWSYWGVKSADVIPLDPPVLAADKNIVVSQQAGNALHGINATTGEIVWESSFYEGYEDGIELFMVNSSQVQLVSLNGLIYALHPAGRAIAINSQTGSLVWSQDLNAAQSFWLSGDLIFVATKDNNLIAVDRHNGKIKWVSQLPSTPAKKAKKEFTWLTQPIVADGDVLLTSTDGQIHKFNYNDGTYLGAIKVTDAATAPPIIANNSLFIINHNGIEQISTKHR